MADKKITKVTTIHPDPNNPKAYMHVYTVKNVKPKSDKGE